METYEAIFNRMKEVYQQESGCQVADVSEVGLRLQVLAGELQRLGASLDWLERQAFPQTADGVYLDMHGAQRGVTRQPAKKAAGVVSFSRYLPLAFNLVVPQGTVCATSGEPVVEYQTTQEAVLEAGELTVDVPVEALVAGSQGNAAAGYVTTLVSAPVGLDYASNEAPLTGGADEEGDEGYRVRVLDAWAHSPNGTNADYYRALALGVEGVSMVQVVPPASAAAGVKVYLWGQGEAPSAQVVEAVSQAMEARREMGIPVSVQAARKVTVAASVQLQLPDTVDFTAAQTQVQQALSAYFETLGVGEGYLLTDLVRVVLETVPATKVQFPSTARDMTGIQGVVYRPSAVTVEELA